MFLALQLARYVQYVYAAASGCCRLKLSTRPAEPSRCSPNEVRSSCGGAARAGRQHWVSQPDMEPDFARQWSSST
jgi:hypothetical protein